MSEPLSQAAIDPEAEERQRLRRHDLLIDYMKHLTTLSTGSIILQVAFLEKVFPDPKWKALIAISLISLGLCVIAAVAVHTLLLGYLDEMGEQGDNILALSLIVAWGGFLIGIIALGVFGLKNLLTL